MLSQNLAHGGLPVLRGRDIPHKTWVQRVIWNLVNVLSHPIPNIMIAKTGLILETYIKELDSTHSAHKSTPFAQNFTNKMVQNCHHMTPCFRLAVLHAPAHSTMACSTKTRLFTVFHAVLPAGIEALMRAINLNFCHISRGKSGTQLHTKGL